MRGLLHTVVVALVMLFGGCANQIAPSGGPRDKEAPKALSMGPPNYSVNFQGKEIYIAFDEFIKLNNPLQQIVISPPQETPPEIRINKKALVIQLKDSLKENTTYQINLGKGVQDITESNSISNLVYVFSTGQELDSAEVKGRVIDAETLSPVKDVLVMLYKDLSDSAIYKHKPYYFARTDESGAYELTFLAEGNYRISALEDKNSNYLFDLPGERIAFYSKVININDSIVGNYSLKLFEEKAGKQQLLSSYSAPGVITIVYSQPLDEFKWSLVTPVTNYPRSEVHFSNERDTVRIWYDYNLSDEQSIALVANDSILDTIYVRQEIVTMDSLATIKRPFVFTKTKKNRSFTKFVAQDLKKALTLKFNRAITDIDESKVRLWADSMKKSVVPVLELDSSGRVLQVKAKWKEGTQYDLVMLPGAVHDWYGLTNDTIKRTFKTRAKDYYGNIFIKLDSLNRERTYIVSLLNKEGGLVKRYDVSRETSTELEATWLAPGPYKIKIVVDENGNGEWDTGNYIEKKEPERIYIYPDPINLKESWDLDIEISVID